MPNPILNLRNPYDRVELTNAVNEAQYIPHELEELLPWNSEGVSTRQVFIEIDADGSVGIVAEANPRSGNVETLDDHDESGYTLRIPYYPQMLSMLAESLQDRRAFGSTEIRNYLLELSKKIDKMKQKNALTREFIRAGALQGIIYKKSGAVSQNLFTLSGKSKTTHGINLTDSTTDVVQEVIEAVAKSEDKLGAYQGLTSGYKLIAGANVYRKMARHARVQKDFSLWSATGGFGNQGSAARDDMRRGFPITTNVQLVSYAKGKIVTKSGTLNFLDPDKALLCPIVPGLYQTRYAPGTHKDVVNTPGVPEYSMIEPMKFGKGDEVLMEMACVSYLERPDAIVEITDSGD